MTVENLRTVLGYNPVTGVVFWLKSGKPAGTKKKTGYISVDIRRKKYMAHRIAWAIHHGTWPPSQIDHINGVRDDNRACNLRSVTPSENNKNVKMLSRNTSGCTGVFWDYLNRKWRAQIHGDEGRVYLGVFDHKEEAIAARKTAERQLGYHPNHGRAA